MKLSEILKTSGAAPDAVSEPRPSRPPLPPDYFEKRSSQPAPPPQEAAINLDEIRKEIENRLSRDFQRKLDFLEKETRKAEEALLKAEEEKFFAKSEMFKREKNQLMAQIEELKKQNAQIGANQESIESLKKQMEEAQKKILEDFHRQLKEKDEQLRRKDEQPQAPALSENEKQQIRKQAQDELDEAMRSKIHQLEAKIKDREEAIENLKKKDLSSAPAAQPAASLQVPFPPPPKIGPALLEGIYASPETLAIYQDLVHQGIIILKELSMGKANSLPKFMESLKKMIQFAPQNDDDLIAVFIEPYPEKENDYFVYHCANSALLAILLGLDLKLSSNDLEDLAVAAFFHDAGLLNHPSALGYPKKPTASMDSEIKNHPEKGATLMAAYVNERIVKAIRQHHEIENGQGYPNGITEINLFAKIIAAVDCFEAMIHTRPYRHEPLEVNQAVKEMIEKQRGLYDRDVMKALLGRVGLYPVKILVELSNKQIARVLRQNRLFPLSPIVQIEFDEHGNKLFTPQIMDLTKNPLIHIVGPVTSKISPTSKAEPGEAGSHRLKLMPSASTKEEKKTIIKELMPILLIVAALGILIYLVIKL